jgi:hypothetical protein
VLDLQEQTPEFPVRGLNEGTLGILFLYCPLTTHCSTLSWLPVRPISSPCRRTIPRESHRPRRDEHLVLPARLDMSSLHAQVIDLCLNPALATPGARSPWLVQTDVGHRRRRRRTVYRLLAGGPVREAELAVRGDATLDCPSQAFVDQTRRLATLAPRVNLLLRPRLFDPAPAYGSRAVR